MPAEEGPLPGRAPAEEKWGEEDLERFKGGMVDYVV